ncbi:RNA helicase HEL117-like protein [Ophiocordyceps camponoti-floridani]|uniref:RNA helicase HEL117-like protein n=1 Tax=Ophiocordyceps camponoti-floridani TaxID=2030778 RepID=A0A8H4QDM8_9HYPO|nr:RNA helicase HEL117-like protein [Ophiocordyceps camponoti-floridani]
MAQHYRPSRDKMPEPSRDDVGRSRRRLPRPEGGSGLDGDFYRPDNRPLARKRRGTASPDRDSKRPIRRASPIDHSKGSKRQHQPSSHHTEDRVEVQLPFSARPLVKSDLEAFGSLFAYYLGVQKCKNAYEMDERELKGRWKRFVRRWNSNQLAEGWYDPDTFARIAKLEEEGWGEDGDEETRGDGRQSGAPPVSSDDDDDEHVNDEEEEKDDDDDDDDDDYGPSLPHNHKANPQRRVGAKIPTLQDLSVRDELIRESQEAERSVLRAARKADRKQQKERLEELAPRAEAGTHERRMEKRRETNDKMRQFRDKSPGDGVAEKDLMGGGDLVDEFRQMKARERRRKSERQVRREEMERAQREINEAKRRAWQLREEETVGMLRELARQRFG